MSCYSCLKRELGHQEEDGARLDFGLICLQDLSFSDANAPKQGGALHASHSQSKIRAHASPPSSEVAKQYETRARRTELVVHEVLMDASCTKKKKKVANQTWRLIRPHSSAQNNKLRLASCRFGVRMIQGEKTSSFLCHWRFYLVY